jgi:hypothetical protein
MVGRTAGPSVLFGAPNASPARTGRALPTTRIFLSRRSVFLKFFAGRPRALTRKRECRTTLRWHQKIPRTRVSRNGIVTDTSSHESYSLPQSIAIARSIQPLNDFNLERALACAKARFASIARGHSALVCRFQPVNRLDNRVPWRLVRHLADQLRNRNKTTSSKI